jgi:predicted Zn-dependent protease
MLWTAGIDPGGMIAFLERLSTENGKAPAVLPYLSTHPDPAHRIEQLRSVAAPSHGKFTKLLPDSDWREVAKICQATGS